MSKPKTKTTNKGTAGTQRFTFDVPDELHRTIKAACALRGVSMTTEIQRVLRIAFRDEPARNSADGRE
jgi:predicted HicB family RNase H-like nuclease